MDTSWLSYASSLGPIGIIALLIGMFVIAPAVLLILFEWKYKKNFAKFIEFLILAFVLNTGSFLAGAFVSLATLALLGIPMALIIYVVFLFIDAAFFWLNDKWLDKFGMYNILR